MTTATTTTTTTPTIPLSYNLLSFQNALTSNALMEYWQDSTGFQRLSQAEGAMTVARDQEDAAKLQVGIDYAKAKGVIDPDFVPEPYVTLDVLGKSPDQVAKDILATVQQTSTRTSSTPTSDNNNNNNNDDNKDDTPTSTTTVGSVIVLCGLSGTGKGTTVTRLRQMLQHEQGRQVVTWSNGNIFRSVTLLAATWSEQQQQQQEPGKDGGILDAALTKEHLEEFMGMLEFGKFNGQYDTRIHGLGLDLLVSQVQNTVLKQPKVSKNIPTVAQMTQGEVILFAAKAVQTMGQEEGLVVLLEGREQTVNYVRTPHRFTLVLSDDTLIGKRRAAQRIMAEALKELEQGASDEQVKEVLEGWLEKMVSEVTAK